MLALTRQLIYNEREFDEYCETISDVISHVIQMNRVRLWNLLSCRYTINGAKKGWASFWVTRDTLTLFGLTTFGSLQRMPSIWKL